MEFLIIPTASFEKDMKFYQRKKKYFHIIDDIENIIEELKKGNFLGEDIPELKLPEDESTYKVRAINSDTKVGKADGYRLIYYVIKNEYEIYLLTIYYKKDKETINTTEIIDLIKKNCI